MERFSVRVSGTNVQVDLLSVFISANRKTPLTERSGAFRMEFDDLGVFTSILKGTESNRPTVLFFCIWRQTEDILETISA